MTEQERAEVLHRMLSDARVLAQEADPVLDEAMPRVAAILHDILRLVDLDYLDDNLR